jgi:hypothetical protein
MNNYFDYINKETYESSLFRIGMESIYKYNKNDTATYPLPSYIMHKCIDEINNHLDHFKNNNEIDGIKHQIMINCINNAKKSHS